MKINILTIFPEYFENTLSSSILKRAQEKNLIEFSIINIRDFATDKHKMTDDRPYGGGAGMVMKIEPIDRALQALTKQPSPLTSKVVLTSAKGKLFTQPKALEYSKLNELTIICGHYEGVDERVAENLADEEIRIGDFVLTGGEAAALVISDAVSRLLPGVLGNQASLKQESHSENLKFSHPVYTTPQNYKSWQVPELLLSGHHQRIEEWRKEKRENK
ncbi:MAG: tRNA (guanosine(37)-N1)-methyltransferase TrmD [Patescibacteria group bacterium]